MRSLVILFSGLLLFVACKKQAPAPDKAPTPAPNVNYLKALKIAPGLGGYVALRTDGKVVYSTGVTGYWLTSSITGVVDVANGALMLKGDGTVWNLFDSLHQPNPWQVSGLNNITAICGCGNSSYALRNDGTVWAWGKNNWAQLGDSTLIDRYTPVQVKGLSGMVAISGWYHGIALKNDGTVWGWGRNFYGALSYNSNVGDTVRKAVQLGGFSGITAISAGNSVTYAVKNDGTVWSCGLNTVGELGDGTTTNRSYPVQVSGLTGVRSVSGGDVYGFALKNDSTVWGWGYNNYGNLGDATTYQRLTPVKVYYLQHIKLICAGSFALENDGTAWAWGDNLIGELGLNNDHNTIVSPPQRIVQ